MSLERIVSLKNDVERLRLKDIYPQDDLAIKMELIKIELLERIANLLESLLNK